MREVYIFGHKKPDTDSVTSAIALAELKNNLLLEERSGLEGIYNAIDTLILSKKEDSDIVTFEDELKLHLKFIKDTKKEYIKEHIIPIINKVSNKGWGKNG